MSVQTLNLDRLEAALVKVLREHGLYVRLEPCGNWRAEPDREIPWIDITRIARDLERDLS